MFVRVSLVTSVRHYFKSLFDTAIEFLWDSVFCHGLRNIRYDIFYLSNIFTKFTEKLNCGCKETMLALFKSNQPSLPPVRVTFISTKPSLSSTLPVSKPLWTGDDIELDDHRQVYCARMDEFWRSLSRRFHNTLLLQIPDWMISVFLEVYNEETGVAKEKLVSIRNDTELRLKFKKSYKF